VVAHRREQLRQVMVVQAVAAVAAVPAHRDEAVLAQHAQLMGRRARAQTDHAGELVDAALAVDEGPQQAEPARGREHADRVSELLGLLVPERPLDGRMFARLRHARTVNHPRPNICTSAHMSLTWWA
jgi:hypothetical protein